MPTPSFTLDIKAPATPLTSPVSTTVAHSTPSTSIAPIAGAISNATPAGYTPAGSSTPVTPSVTTSSPAVQAAVATTAAVNNQVTNLATNSTSPTASKIVSSSDNVVADENNTKSTVAGLTLPNNSADGARNASQQYMSTLTDYLQTLEQRRQSEIQGINASFDQTKKDTEKTQNSETATNVVGLQRIGGYLGGSASAIGALNNLAETHKADIANLEAKRAAAIQQANNAIDDQQFKVASALAQEAKDIEKEIADRNDKFFNQSLNLVQEQERQSQNAFKNSLDTVDRVASTVQGSIEGMSPADAANFISAAAKDYKVDPNLLLGKVNDIISEKQAKETASVTTLAQKYPDAGIDPNKDSFTAAEAKIRGSRSYQLDIAKSETDIANTRSLLSSRASDNSINYSSPILKLYTQATGKLASSPSEARAVQGYAESLLSGKEIVADDYAGALADNQIRAKDAQSMITSAFTQLPNQKGFGEVSDSQVWSWLATPEAKDYSDEDKKSYIMQAGKNPEDFGIF